MRVVVVGAVLGPTFFGNSYQLTNVLPNLVFYGFLAGSLLSSLLVPALVRHIDAGDGAETGDVVGLGREQAEHAGHDGQATGDDGRAGPAQRHRHRLVPVGVPAQFFPVPGDEQQRCEPTEHRVVKRGINCLVMERAKSILKNKKLTISAELKVPWLFHSIACHLLDLLVKSRRS